MADVRVRFAPSPTGYLHIGGARTALFSWLWARKTGGSFVLRIEDTDRERSTEESVQVVLHSLRWLGLDWDEGPEVGGDRGPYRQTERLSIYREVSERLIDSGHAYRCYATKEEIQAQREAFEKGGGKGFRFESPFRDRKEERDAPFAVRLKAERAGQTGWDDLVKGRIDYPNAEQQDVILLRSDGVPLYNFGCFVDDLTMGMTLVARGDDHLVNTPVQLMLYAALGEAPPVFAHLPMILGPDGQKLSKRHAAVGVLEYRDRGYLPDAVLNYLARLGWSHGDQEIFRRQELIALFDWAHVGSTASRYDAKKFEHVQGEHLRMLGNEQIAALSTPFCEARGLEVAREQATLQAAIEHVKLRATTLEDVARDVDYFFRDELAYEEKGRAKFLRPEHAPRLRAVAELVASTEPFTVETLDAKVKTWMEAEGVTFKDFAQSARVSLTGRTASPGLFEVMTVLGRDRAVARLRRGADLAEATAG